MIAHRTNPDFASHLPDQFFRALVALAADPNETGPQVAARLMDYLRVLGFQTRLRFDLSNSTLALDEVTALVEEIRAFMREAGQHPGSQAA